VELHPEGCVLLLIIFSVLGATTINGNSRRCSEPKLQIPNDKLLYIEWDKKEKKKGRKSQKTATSSPVPKSSK